MRPAKLIVVVIGLLLSSCTNPKKGYDLANKATEALHAQMEAGQNAEIFAAASPRFQVTLRFTDFDGFMNRIKRKMGTCENGAVTGINYNANTLGTFVTLAYRRKCANGDLDETLVWEVGDGKAQLFGYKANSTQLLTD